jgi:hypothetical protein
VGGSQVVDPVEQFGVAVKFDFEVKGDVFDHCDDISGEDCVSSHFGFLR